MTQVEEQLNKTEKSLHQIQDQKKKQEQQLTQQSLEETSLKQKIV